MSKKKPKPHPLDDGLIAAMIALDNQISREINTRSPEERAERGVQKWDPLDKRIENVAVLVMNALGRNVINLDSVLVLAQAMTKSLQLVVEDLGQEGLGSVRSGYCEEAFERLSKMAERGTASVAGKQPLM